MTWVKELAQYASAETHSTLYVKDGEKRYNTKQEPLTEALVERHLTGGQEIGIHLLDKSGKGHCIVLDFDDHDGTDQRLVDAVVRSYAMHLDHHNVPCIIERSRSGTGYHIWLVFEKPKRYDQLRDAAKRILATVPTDKDFLVEGAGGVAKGEVEIFPKGSSVGTSNIALPGAGKSVRLELNGQMELVETDRDDVPLLKAAKTGPRTDQSKPVNVEAAFAAYKVAIGKVDDYETWLASGFHIKAALGEDGFALWHTWAQECAGYESEDACRRKWDNDLRDPRCPPETFWAYAKKGGYSGGLPEGIVLKGTDGDKVLLFDLLNDIRLVHSDVGEPFAIIAPGQALEVLSTRFENYITVRAEKELSQFIPGDHYNTLRRTACGRASELREDVFLRVAKVVGTIYVALYDDMGTVIEIDAQGWRVAENPPPFRRSLQKPLPMPVPGSIDDLRPFVNCSDFDWLLTKTAMIKSYLPAGLMPILNIDGEYGATKTSAMVFIRSVLDPAPAIEAGPPKNESDLAVRAYHNHIVTIDEAEEFERLAKSFTRLATGGGLITRRLFTNGEQHVVEYKRVVIANGIGAVLTRPDLISRTINVELQVPDEYVSEEEIRARFNDALPGILGGVCDLVSKVLARLPTIKVRAKDRYIDVVKVGEIIAQDGGNKPGFFEDEYVARVTLRLEEAGDDEPLVRYISRFLGDRERYDATPATFLADLRCYVEDSMGMRYVADLPESPSGFGQIVKNQARAFRSRGIYIKKERRVFVVRQDLELKRRMIEAGLDAAWTMYEKAADVGL